MKDDEKQFLERLQKRTAEDPNTPYVRQLVADLGMNEKRAAYICEKWAENGWYEYGINVLAGWLTEEGMALRRRSLAANERQRVRRQVQRLVRPRVAGTRR